MAESKTTKNHEEIRSWIEARKGKPSVVQNTEILRVDFPNFSGEERLEEISWDRFLQIFDKNNLTFLYQEKLDNGDQSRFSKFIEE